jgi:ribosomal RNA small subunit methyltransferase D
MIYLISKYYEYKLVDFKEAGFDWLVKFENTNKLEKQRFHRERIVSIKKEQKINLVLNSDLIDEKIKEKIKFCYNL